MKDYGKPGVPRITVYLWGYADTGVWTVAEGTDLMEFLSVASRVPPNIRPNNRVIRTLTVFRNGYTKEKPYFKSRLNKMFATRSGYPDLQNGDILVLNTQERPRFTWRDIARVTGTVVGVLNTYLLLDRLNDDNN